MEGPVCISTLDPCHSWTSLCKNVWCTGSPGSLEGTGITVLVVILSPEQLLELSEDLPLSILCFSLELYSSFLVIICRTARVLYFCKEFYLFLFHPPTGGFCFASGFLAVYPAFEQELMEPAGIMTRGGMEFSISFWIIVLKNSWNKQKLIQVGVFISHTGQTAVLASAGRS